MNAHQRALVATAALSVVMLAGCRSKPPGDQETKGPPLPEPIVPVGYQKIAPAPADDSVQILRQTAAIVRGSLKNIRFTYDGCAGPRTTYVFSDASSLAGTRVDNEVAVKVLGGPTPAGRWVRVAELPQLALDSEYIVFLRNTDWTYSPIVSDLALRVETVAGRQVLVHPSGRAVTGWGDAGPTLSAGTVSEVVGGRQLGYKTADTPAPADSPDSATTDPRGQFSSAGAQQPPATGRPGDSPIARAPSLADMRRARMFARPALTESAIANERTVSSESLVAAVRAAADRAQVSIGGRTTLDPNWRCWSSTPTAMSR